MVNTSIFKEASWMEQRKISSQPFVTNNCEQNFSCSSFNSQKFQYDYDILLIYDSEEDYYYAQDLLDLLQTKQLRIFDFAKDCPPGPSQREMFASALKASMYTSIVVTRNFINNFWLKFKTEMAIQNMLQNSEKQNSIIVVVMDPCLKLDDLPLELQVISPLMRSERYFLHRFQKSFSGLPFAVEPGQFGSSIDRKMTQFPRSMQSNQSAEYRKSVINSQHSMPFRQGQGNAGINPSFNMPSRRLPQEHDATSITNNKSPEAVQRQNLQMLRRNVLSEESVFHPSCFSCNEQHNLHSSERTCDLQAHKAMSDDHMMGHRTQLKQSTPDHERIQLQHPSSQFSSASIQRRRTDDAIMHHHQRQLFQQSMSSPEFDRRESQQQLMDSAQERKMNFACIPQVENFKSSDYGSYQPVNRHSYGSSYSNQIFNSGNHQSTLQCDDGGLHLPNDQRRISCDSTQRRHLTTNLPSSVTSGRPHSASYSAVNHDSRQVSSTCSGKKKCLQPLESSSTGYSHMQMDDHSFQNSCNGMMTIDSIDDIEVQISTDSSISEPRERQNSIVKSVKSSISKFKKIFK